MHRQHCTEQESFYDTYESFYDYTVYDINFVFVDEEEEEEELFDDFYDA